MALGETITFDGHTLVVKDLPAEAQQLLQVLAWLEGEHEKAALEKLKAESAVVFTRNRVTPMLKSFLDAKNSEAVVETPAE